MTNFRQKLLTAALILGVSASVFGQKGNDSGKRPPKGDPPKVVVKDQKPPPPKGRGKG